MNARIRIKNTIIALEVLIPALFYTVADFGTGEPILYAVVCYFLFILLLVNHSALLESKWYRFTMIIIQIPAIVSWFHNQGEYFRLFYASLPITILGSIAHGIILGHNLLFFTGGLRNKNS